YEMLTGTKAFAGDSAITTLTAILRDEVKPIDTLVPDVPTELVEIIGLALRKDPKDRWQSMQVLHTVLAAQKQKFDSGVFQKSGFAQAPPVAPSSIFTSGSRPPSTPSMPPTTFPGNEHARRSGKKWAWIVVGLAIAFWGKTCGSSRDRTK